MKTLIGLIIFLGSLTWVLTMFKSGLVYDYGIGFWGPNGHDGVWHIALANNLAKGSWENPVFAAENIKNYHIGFDLFLSSIHKLTKLPITILYFQVLPLIFAIVIGLLVYKLTKSRWSVFFVYFGGSTAWLLGKGESAFWSQQAISTLVNPPFALSLILILLGLLGLVKKNYFLSILSFGILIQVKAYSAILVLAGLFVASVYTYYTLHSTYYVKIFFGTLFLNLVLAFAVPNDGLSAFKWQPFWFLETMMTYSDRLGWQRYYSAMTSYKMGGAWFKEVVVYGVAFAIFIIGNFWTRLFFLKDIFKKLDELKIFYLSIILVGIIIPTFFVQTGTPWNTIQFIYYSLFFSGILAGLTIKSFNRLVVLVILLLTIPTTYITLRDVYIPNRPPAKISSQEMDALNFLKAQPEGVVLTYPFDKEKSKKAEANPPRPLYLYESTAYVSAYSNKSVYVENEVSLDITNYNWRLRIENVENWLKESDELKAKDFLEENNIKYIYWVKPQRALLGDKQLGLLKIFENEESIIYKYEQDFGSY